MKRCFTESCLSITIYCTLVCCLLSSQVLAQERVITGSVKSVEDQSLVAGVNVVVVPDGYIAQLGAVSKENIISQKWIALFGEGIEAWNEYRRTCYPVMPAADLRAKFQNDGALPTRLVYPSTEYSLNGVQVKGAEILNAGRDNMKTKMWVED